MERQPNAHQGLQEPARACRGVVRKAKAQLELKFAKDVKNNKKGFFR